MCDETHTARMRGEVRSTFHDRIMNCMRVTWSRCFQLAKFLCMALCGAACIKSLEECRTASVVLYAVCIQSLEAK